jgi:predicted dinucleotide-binding enzyme
MRIAVVGAGNIGRTLGTAWARAGHEVAYASRNPDPPETVAIDDALSAADVVLLAIPGAAVDDFADRHAERLSERLVIDATNRIGAERMNSAEELAHRVPDARLVRAFNSVGWEVMADPGESSLFWCGPDGADGELVEQLIADVGFQPVRVGGMDAVDVVDGAARIWLTLVFQRGYPRSISLKLLGA